MKKIALRGKHGMGKFALVDDDNFEELNKYKWRVHDGYPIRSVWAAGENLNIYMHRQIMKPPKGMVTDHKFENKLDNRKKKLRTCTHSQNRMNRGKTNRNTTGYKGVRIMQNKYIIAEIGINGKTINLGYFKNKTDAAKAYNEAALKYFGEFSRLNNV